MLKQPANPLPTVYLAGPIAGLSWEAASGWRAYASAAFERRGVRALSPLRQRPKLIGSRYIPSTETHYSDSEILARDFLDVFTCDLLLANFLGAEHASPGSCIEIGWAFALRKPVVVCMEADNPHDRALVRATAWFVTDSLRNAIDAAARRLKEEPRYAA
jgi:nucleoside 2-deoxyribosyltransferase